MGEIITSSVDVSSGNTMTGLLVQQGGVLKILNGGFAQEVGLDGGKTIVSGGGILLNCTVSAGGTATVMNSGWAESVSVKDGGLYVLSSGASMQGAMISAGGTARIGATVMATGVTVLEGGILHVSSGGYARATTVSQGGTMNISAAGLVVKAQMYGSAVVFSTGCFSSSVVYGTVTVHSKGSAYNAVVSSGGSLELEGGGVANRTSVNGGIFTVSAGAGSLNAKIDGGTMTLAAGSSVPSPKPGGSANNTTVNADGKLEVSSGAIADSATVNPGGSMFVSAGGTATEIRENGGYVQVADGADVTFVANTINNLLLENTSATIHSGTTAINATVNPGGELHVYSGGSATIVFNPWQGQISSSPGADVVYLERDANVYCRKEGVTTKADLMDSLELASEDEAIVYSDGIINGATVNPGGNLRISGGGKLTGKMVFEEDAVVSMYEGALLNFDLTQAEAGAEAALVNDLSIIQGTPSFTLTVDEDLGKGAYILAEGATDFPGAITVQNVLGEDLGTLTVDGTLETDNRKYTLNLTDDILSLTCYALIKDRIINKTASVSPYEIYRNPTVNFGGKLTVSSGGTAIETVVKGSGSMVVSSGGTATDTAVNSGGSMIVSAGGMANNTTVSRGNLYVENSGTVNDTTITGGTEKIKGGNMFVSSGGTANRTTVDMGYHLTVFSGGIMNDATVNIGWVIVSSGGTATGIVENGGYIDIMNGADVTFKANTFNGLTIEWSATVHSGTTAVSTTLKDHGSLTICSGGIANYTTVKDSATLNISSGGTANNITVKDHSTLNISSGGTAICTTIDSGIRFSINGGASANVTTVNTGGSFFVENGGTAMDIVENGGYVRFTENANVSFKENTFNGLVLNRTSATVHSGTTAVDATVNDSGALIIYSGGTAANTTVNAGGRLSISSGGSAPNTTVNAGGRLSISSGGSATAIMENGGFVYVANGADVTFKANTFSGLVLNRTSATVHSGTTAVSTAINDSGTLFICSGGSAPNTTVNAGGYLYISSGGTATDIVWTPCEGHVYVRDGGYATFANQYSGVYYGSDNQLLSHEVKLDDKVVGSSCEMFVMSGGIARNATVNESGGLRVSGGGKLTGKMVFEGGAVISMYEGAVLNFALTQAEAGADALVNDLSIIQGTPTYTLTVDEDLAPGSYVYALADGADGFDGTISVVNEAGNEFGLLTVGGTVKVGYDDYTLNLTDGTLSVIVEAPDLTPTNLVGTPERVSWDATGANEYIVEYSADSFDHAIRATTPASAMDLLELPAGTYQWRVKADANSDWAVGEEIVSDLKPGGPPKAVQSNADGSDDIFFAVQDGAWEDIFYAMNAGSLNDWNGTKEIVFAGGKGHIRNLFFGSNDANILCLTDSDTGDSIFVDDEFTGQPESLAEQQARLAEIDEIRAGAGDDLIDMTSNRIEYTGDGLTIRGGDGDDIIWANKGGNMLFGDAGNDRLVGASGDDVVAGGVGDDSMHGGGGDDTFTFCDNWGADTVEQIAGGFVTLWFASGSMDNWDAETLTYSDGANSVAVRGAGIDAGQVILKFGAGDTPEDAARFAALSGAGAFDAFTSQKVFEESASIPGTLA